MAKLLRLLLVLCVGTAGATLNAQVGDDSGERHDSVQLTIDLAAKSPDRAEVDVTDLQDLLLIFTYEGKRIENQPVGLTVTLPNRSSHSGATWSSENAQGLQLAFEPKCLNQTNVNSSGQASAYPCGTLIATSDARALTVFVADGSIGIHASVNTPATGVATARHDLTIDLGYKPWDLVWSGGFTFTSVRDQRYRIVTDAGIRKAKRESANGAEPGIAAFANYMNGFGSPSWGLAFGIGTGKELDDLTLMLGITGSARTPILRYSGHLTAGVMYGTHQVLRREYREAVPVDVPENAIYENDRDFGLFVGVSFRFLGASAQQRFVKVYDDKGTGGS
jgi:hypothetical protein